MTKQIGRFILSAIACMAIAACGGGGSSSSTATINGIVSVTNAGQAAGKQARAASVMGFGTIQVVNAAGQVLGIAVIRSDGTFTDTVPAGHNYVIRAVKGNVCLKAFVPTAASTFNVVVDPASSAAVKVLGIKVGYADLGDPGLYLSDVLANYDVSSIFPEIINSPLLAPVSLAIQADISQNADYSSTANPTVGVFSTAALDSANGVATSIATSTSTNTSTSTDTGVSTNTSTGTSTSTDTGTGTGADIAVVPSIPSGVTATPGDGQVTVSWSAVAGAIFYNVYVYSGFSPINASLIKKVPFLTATSTTVTGLTNDQPYYFSVRAENVVGEGVSCPFVTATPVILPSTPAGVTVTAGDGQALVSWNPGGNTTSYNVYYGTTEVTTSSFTKVTGLTATEAAITGLSNGTTYYFIVTGVNDKGESAASSPVAGVPFIPLPSPGGVTATPGDRQVTVSWNAVAGAISYNVYYGATPATTAQVIKVGGVTTTSTPIIGFNNGTEYFFIVRAVDAYGEGAASSLVTAIPNIPPPAPFGVAAVAGNRQVTVSWSPEAGATSYNVYYGSFTGVTIANGTKIMATGASEYTISGLIDGLTYYFAVTSVKGGVESYASVEAHATPVAATLVPGVTPSSLAVDSASVYWTESGAVNKAPIGGGPATTLASGLNNPSSFAVDSTSVYWTESGALKKVLLGGGVVTTLTSGLNSPSNIVVDSTSVYWTENKTVRKMPAGGGLAVTLAAGFSPSSIVVDAANVYWTDSTGAVCKVSTGGGVVTILALGLTNPARLAVDSTSVYWTESGAVKKVSINGGAAATLAEGLNNPVSVAVDAVSVYWAESGAVKKAPLNGGAAATLATGLGNPSLIVLNSTNVYWVESGAVKMMPK